WITPASHAGPPLSPPSRPLLSLCLSDVKDGRRARGDSEPRTEVCCESRGTALIGGKRDDSWGISVNVLDPAEYDI
ncbi:MAG: hypothetical protein ABI988_10505, partial [Nitrospirota bacterium]